MKTKEYYAKIVFLNASTLNTAFILLNSVSDIFPEGFGNSSGQLGHHLMDHHIGVGASGVMEGFENSYYYGRRPTTTYIPRFRNINDQTKHADFIRGLSFGTGAWRSGAERHVQGVPIGADLKEALTEPGSWSFDFSGEGGNIALL